MKIRLYSDLHYGVNTMTPFHIPDPIPGEILVLAGDVFDSYSKGLAHLQRVVDSDRTVILVPGNHEYHSRDLLEDNKQILLDKVNSSNFHILDNDTLTINNIKFLGTTLWTDLIDIVPYKELKKLISSSKDFKAIYYNGKPITLDERQELFNKAVHFLNEEITKDSVVISHFLPSYSLIYKDYKDSIRTPLFASHLDYLILRKKPKFWFYGHNHYPNDSFIGDTRMLCNSYGYQHKGEGLNFNPNFILEL